MFLQNKVNLYAGGMNLTERYKFLSIEQFNDLLNEWNNSKIKISKLEMDDLDEIMMYLERVSYHNDKPTIDGYKQVHHLKLNGVGIIETENNVYESLPMSQYEIPLESDTLYEFDGTHFIISTERGVYKINRLEHN